jgi:hypothetical protein
VAITAASSGSNGIQALDNANLDMGTNSFTPWVRKRITTTRPSANEILYHKHDGTNGVIITLLTTGILRLTLNGLTYDSTVALTSATNVAPLIQIPVARETASVAGSVTFVVDGVQLGSAVVIAAHGDLTTERISNGDFVASPGAWVNASVGTGNAVIGGGSAVITGTDSPNRGAMQQDLVGIVAGDVIEVVLTGTVASGVWRMGATAIDTAPNGVIATGVSTARFVATGATPRIYIWHVAGAGASATFTACSVKKVASVNNAVPLYVLGTSTTRTEGDFYEAGLYNRALTVAECLRHAVMGPAPQDIATGSAIPNQTILSSWTWSNFGGGSGFETFTTSGSDITSAINTSGLGIASAAYTSVFHKRYRIRMNLTVNSGTVELKWNSTTDLSSGGQQIGVYTSANDGELEIEFVCLGSYTRLGFYSNGSSNFSVTGFTLQLIGVVANWNAEDAQSNTGQVLDKSGNKNHALLPASGATVIGASPDRRRQVRWTNTWSGTHELQYIGGVDQAILPSNAYIESIVGTVSGATVEDIIIGDGSDTDRYVTITTGLAAGTSSFTLANRTTDGTNLKLTVDPDANATMSIAWVITYYTLEG